MFQDTNWKTRNTLNALEDMEGKFYLKADTNISLIYRETLMESFEEKQQWK